MNAMFPSSRPNVAVRVLSKIPATMVGAGGIGVNKVNGVWTITPQWGDLLLIAPGTLLDPTSKEIWVHDPVTDVYNRMTLGGMGQALFWGTSSTSVLIGAGEKIFTTQSGKDWAVGSFVQAISQSDITNFMIGQVTGYVGNTLTINSLAIGGAGSHDDWTIISSTLPGSGAPGADGVAGGLNYEFVAGLSGDPGAGNVGFNSATIASITEMRISETDRNGVNLAAEIATWDDSTSVSRARVRILSPTAPNRFVIASISGPLVDNGTWVTIPLTAPVGTTLPAVGDCQVEVYRTGDKGDTGDAGTNGVDGEDGISAGARYQYDTSTAAADPGAGKWRTNNANPTLATALYLNETTTLAQNIAAVIASWDDSSSSANRGTLNFQSFGAPGSFLNYRINGNITDNGAWVTIPVVNVGGTNTWSASEEALLAFSRTGDQGAAGAGSGDMIAANNLSELTSPPTARSNLGLGSVDNTSDANKPVSTAQATAIATKAPLDASYIVVALNATLPNERNLAAGTGITLTDGGVGAALTIALNLGMTGVTFTGALNFTGAVVMDSARIKPRVTSMASNAAPPVNTDVTDFVDITALAADITSMTSGLTGTPTNGQVLKYRIKPTANRNITWGTSFEACGVALPTSVTSGKRTTVGLIWDSTTSKWGCVAAVVEA